MFELAPADLLSEYTNYMQIERLDEIMRGRVGASQN